MFASGEIGDDSGRDAISNLPKIYPLKESYKSGNKNISHEIVKTNLTSHIARFVNQKNQEIFSEWVTKGLNSLSTQEQVDYYYKKTGHKTNHQSLQTILHLPLKNVFARS